MASILNLDDEPFMLEVNRQVLERIGHNFIGVTSSREALRLLRKGSIDLFIQDLCRPGDINTGESLYRMLKADPNLRLIPVLINSGRGRNELGQFGIGLMLNGDDYLEKPYDLESFYSKVAQLLARTSTPLPRPSVSQSRMNSK